MTVRILMTGAHGRLGTELQKLLEVAFGTDVRDLDIVDGARVHSCILDANPEVVLHLAAFTDVKAAETDKRTCWKVNVTGTRHVAAAASAAGARLVHISTDYVFSGDRGMYREDDSLGTPANYYALSKLVAEEVARTADRCLVIRTSFRPREWPYATAFTDVHTSQDYVDVIAPMIAEAVNHLPDIPYDTLHIATERKSIYDLARRRAPDVRPVSSVEAGVPYPKDVSLDTSRWESLRDAWRSRGA